LVANLQTNIELRRVERKLQTYTLCRLIVLYSKKNCNKVFLRITG
jgi:hypothetical protein